MGCEDPTGTDSGDGVVERQALGDDCAPDALEHEEPGVALVAVEHVGLDAELGQEPHAPHAQDDFLAQPVLDVAAVEAVGDAVDVEQIQTNGTDVVAPHVGFDGVARQLQAHACIHR